MIEKLNEYDKSLLGIYGQNLPQYVTVCPQCLAKKDDDTNASTFIIKRNSDQSNTYIGILNLILMLIVRLTLIV